MYISFAHGPERKSKPNSPTCAPLKTRVLHLQQVFDADRQVADALAGRVEDRGTRSRNDAGHQRQGHPSGADSKKAASVEGAFFIVRHERNPFVMTVAFPLRTVQKWFLSL